MGKHGSSATTPSDTTFVSITLVRVLAIIGVIVENFITAFSWNHGESYPDIFTSLASTIAGTFVQLFFVVSGFGLTLSCLSRENMAWSDWVRQRIKKVVIPYWVAVTITFAMANLCHYWMADGGYPVFPWTTLLTYLAFMSNVFRPDPTMNWTLWFMPVIIGLYVLFPLMMLVLKRVGVMGLVLFSLLVANGSIAMCLHWGYPVDHQGAQPLFFVDKFALGMVLACIASIHPERFRRLMGFDFFLLGVVLYAISGALVYFHWLGAGSRAYNDLLTAAGLYLMVLYVCRWLSATASPGVLEGLDKMCRSSYLMYLIHGPIILYILKPYLGEFFKTQMSALPMIPLAFMYAMLMFALVASASFIIKKMSEL